MTEPNDETVSTSLDDVPRLLSFDEAERMVEAVLFASSTPLELRDIEARLPKGTDCRKILELLKTRYESRGINLVCVNRCWAFRTAPDLGYLLHHETRATRRLSRAAIETLAIIAYHQPTTRAEIEEIRGVSVSSGTLTQLVELNWIKFGRRRMTPGRPVTFVITTQFLDHFGLESARDLPGLKELRAAGFLDNRIISQGDENEEETAENTLFSADEITENT